MPRVPPFRYNKSGEFNVPYGGIAYNKKDWDKKIIGLQSRNVRTKFLNTDFLNVDFLEFFAKHTPKKQDFIFFDPPYHSEFSTYDKHAFNQKDQERLAHYLLHQCKAKFVLIIKSTPFIDDLYNDGSLLVKQFPKRYLFNIKDRNDKASTHLLVRNYGY